MKRTPLYSAHRKLGAKLIEFGGWEMPVQYTSITDEHLAVRKAAGIFDISHMGEVSITGSDADAFLNQTLTNDVKKLEVGAAQYTLMCNERGGVIDDLYAYRFGANEYLLIINASRIEPDFSWLQARLTAFERRDGIVLKNISDAMGALAIQGPRVVDFIDDISPKPAMGGTVVDRPTQLKKNQIAKIQFSGAKLWIARTGYTGEDGFEIYVPSDPATSEKVWARVMEAGREFGIVPCGLGARNTLRLEARMALYGHEISDTINVWEAGLDRYCKMEKGDFIGRAALERSKATGLTRTLVGLEMIDRGIARDEYCCCNEAGEAVGVITSGSPSPTLGKNIALAYVPPAIAATGTTIYVAIRGNKHKAQVVPTPFYRRPKTVSAPQVVKTA